MSQIFENSAVTMQRSTAHNSKSAIRGMFKQISRSNSTNSTVQLQRVADSFRCLRIVQYSTGFSNTTSNNRTRPASTLRPVVRRNSSTNTSDHRARLPEAVARRKCDGEAPATTQSENALVVANASWESAGQRQRQRLRQHRPRPSRRDMGDRLQRQHHRVVFTDEQKESFPGENEEKVDANASKITNRAPAGLTPTETRRQRRSQRGNSDSNIGPDDSATRKKPAIVNLEFMEPEKRNVIRGTDPKSAERLLFERGNARSTTAKVNGRDSGIFVRHLLHFATGGSSKMSLSNTRIRAEAKSTHLSDPRHVAAIKTAIGGFTSSETSTGKHQKPSERMMTSGQGVDDTVKHAGQHQQPCSTMQAATCDAEPRQRPQLQSCSIPVLGHRMEICFNIDDSATACRRTNPAASYSTTRSPITTSSSINGGVPFRDRLPQSEPNLTRTVAAGSRAVATPASTRRRPTVRHSSKAALPTSSLVGEASRLMTSHSTIYTTSMRKIVDVIGFRTRKTESPLTVIKKKAPKITAPNRHNYAPAPITADDRRPSALALEVFRHHPSPASSPRPNNAHPTVSGSVSAVCQPKPLLRELLLAHDTSTVEAETCVAGRLLGAVNLQAATTDDNSPRADAEASSRLKARVEAWIDDVSRYQFHSGVGVGVMRLGNTESPQNDGTGRRRRPGVRGVSSLSKPSSWATTGRGTAGARTVDSAVADGAVAAKVSGWHARTISRCPSLSTVTRTMTRYARTPVR